MAVVAFPFLPALAAAHVFSVCDTPFMKLIRGSGESGVTTVYHFNSLSPLK
jgi:hypothetical protein